MPRQILCRHSRAGYARPLTWQQNKYKALQVCCIVSEVAAIMTFGLSAIGKCANAPLVKTDHSHWCVFLAFLCSPEIVAKYRHSFNHSTQRTRPLSLHKICTAKLSVLSVKFSETSLAFSLFSPIWPCSILSLGLGPQNGASLCVESNPLNHQ